MTQVLMVDGRAYHEPAIRQLEERIAVLEKERAFRDRVIERAAEGLCVCHNIEEFPFVRFTVWNRRMVEITGYSMEEINRLGWYQTVYPEPEVQAQAAARMARMRQGEDLRGEVWEITRADGDKRLLSISTSVLTTEDTQVHVLALMLDITEEQRALKALQETRRHWEDIFQAIGHPTIIMDADHRILQANRATLAVTGLTHEEIVGKKCLEIFHPDSPEPPPGCPLEKLKTTGRLETVEMEMAALSGVFLVSCTPMFSPDGKLDKIIHIATNISERRRMQEALEKERDFTAALIDSLPGVFYLFDEQGRLLRWNKRMEGLTGYSAAEIARQQPLDFIRTEHRPRVQRAIEEVFLKGEASVEADLLLKNGEAVPYLFTGLHLSLESGPCIIGMGIDISARHQAERRLEEEKEKYRLLTEASPVGVSLIAKDGRYLYVNPKFVEMFGYTLADVPNGREWFFRAFPEESERRRVKALWLEDLQAAGVGEVRPRTFTVTCKDGSHKVIHFRSVSLESGDQLVIYQDLTVLVRASEALKEREETLRVLINANPESLMLLDIQGTVLEANRTVAERLGVPLEDLQGARVWDFLPPEVAAFEKAQLAKVVADGRPLRFEDRRLGRYMENYCYPILDAKGQVTRVAVLGVDLTERREAEEMLRQSEQRYRLLVHNLPALVFTGYVDGTVEFFDDKVENLTGYPRADFESHRLKWVDLMNHEDRPRAEEAFQRALKGDGSYVREYRIRSKKGEALWIQERSQIIRRADGSVDHISGVFFDITAHKRLEEQFFQAQKMEAVGRLAGGVAHDFNNMLTAIMGNLEILLLELHQDDPWRRYVEGIQTAAERAAALTQQLLAFSRKQMLKPKYLNLNEVVTNLEKILQRLLGEDIEWHLALAPDLGVVQADPSQLEQVLMNLAVNARDAMPKGGKLTVETANVELDELYAREHADVLPGPYVMLSVSDTGQGMAAATLTHIFEPFFTTKEIGRGTGLGLSTVYGIVKQSGGHIFVYSEPGLGTTFKLYFPRIAEKAESLAPEAGPVSMLPRGSETILVVEDDAVLREVIAKMLDKFGYRVLPAAHGGEALLVCERYSEPIHLLLTDVVMPHLSGQELAARLACLHPEMKVIYMSGYTDNAIVHYEVLEANLPYLQKPFKLETLVRKVREILDGTQEA